MKSERPPVSGHSNPNGRSPAHSLPAFLPPSPPSPLPPSLSFPPFSFFLSSSYPPNGLSRAEAEVTHRRRLQGLATSRRPSGRGPSPVSPQWPRGSEEQCLFNHPRLHSHGRRPAQRQDLFPPSPLRHQQHSSNCLKRTTHPSRKVHSGFKRSHLPHPTCLSRCHPRLSRLRRAPTRVSHPH